MLQVSSYATLHSSHAILALVPTRYLPIYCPIAPTTQGAIPRLRAADIGRKSGQHPKDNRPQKPGSDRRLSHLGVRNNRYRALARIPSTKPQQGARYPSYPAPTTQVLTMTKTAKDLIGGIDEAADASNVKAEVEHLKCSCIDMQIEYARMDATSLSHSGYRLEKHGTLDQTRAAAIAGTLTHTKAEIDALWKAFLKQWPDK